MSSAKSTGSTHREDISMKIKLRNMKVSKNNAKLLEVESRKMEERLNELKLAMRREKEEREKRGGFWKSGRAGSLNSYAQHVLITPTRDIPSRVSKVRVLKDEPLDTPQKENSPGKMGYIAQRTLTPETNVKSKRCGQCDVKAANLTCVQCSELYCTKCYQAFHSKGALRHHHSRPINMTGVRECLSTRPSSEEYTSSVLNSALSPNGASGKNTDKLPNLPHQEVEPPNSTSSDMIGAAGTNAVSLLDGTYNEEESAASFQDAILEWRGKQKSVAPSKNRQFPGIMENLPKEAVTPREKKKELSDTATSSDDLSPPNQPVTVKFMHGVSYADKLILKHHRRTDLPPLPQSSTSFLDEHVLPDSTIPFETEDSFVPEHIDFDSLYQFVSELSASSRNEAAIASIPDGSDDGDDVNDGALEDREDATIPRIEYIVTDVTNEAIPMTTEIFSTYTIDTDASNMNIPFDASAFQSNYPEYTVTDITNNMFKEHIFTKSLSDGSYVETGIADTVFLNNESNSQTSQTHNKNGVLDSMFNNKGSIKTKSMLSPKYIETDMPEAAVTEHNFSKSLLSQNYIKSDFLDTAFDEHKFLLSQNYSETDIQSTMLKECEFTKSIPSQKFIKTDVVEVLFSKQPYTKSQVADGYIETDMRKSTENFKVEQISNKSENNIVIPGDSTISCDNGLSKLTEETNCINDPEKSSMKLTKKTLQKLQKYLNDSTDNTVNNKNANIFNNQSVQSIDETENNKCVAKKNIITPRLKKQKQPSRSSSRMSGRASKLSHSRKIQSRMSYRGAGELTKSPSSSLQQVITMAADMKKLTYTHDLGEVFVPFLPNVNGTNTQTTTITTRPPSASINTKNSSQNNQSKPNFIKLSNRLYQMSPKSWRPDYSLAEALPLEFSMVGDTLPSLPNLDFSDDIMSASETVVDVTDTAGCVIHGAKDDTNKSQIISPSISMPRTNLQLESPIKHTRNHNAFSDICDVAASECYDVDEDAYTDVDDAETLNQLEWELASQSGRITADGLIMPINLDEQLLTLDNTYTSTLSPAHSLSESELMADFEEMELVMLQDDTNSVKALH